MQRDQRPFSASVDHGQGRQSRRGDRAEADTGLAPAHELFVVTSSTSECLAEAFRLRLIF